MPQQIKIILVDDHPIFRQGLRQIIETETDLQVVAECGDGRSALEAIENHQPDIVILDIDMPLAGGFDVLRHLKIEQRTTKAILLTVHNEIEFFNEAISLGARAYILKEWAIDEMINAVRAVAAGQNYISRPLAHSDFYSSEPHQPRRLAKLTQTEKQILKLIAEYKTNKDIADALFVSPLTVKTHRRNINLKLEIKGSNALMRFALENKGLL